MTKDSLGDLCDFHSGIHMALNAKRKHKDDLITVRTVQSTEVSQNRFLYNATVLPCKDIFRPHQINYIKDGDVLLCALSSSAPTQAVSLAMQPIIGGVITNSVILIRCKPGVDFKVSRLVFWLLSNQKFKNRNFSNIINLEELRAAEIPFTINSDILGMFWTDMQLIETWSREMSAVQKRLDYYLDKLK